MNYEQAKQHKANLETINDKASEALQAFDKLGKSAMGLTPDHVKAMPEWQKAKREFDVSFANLRAFNGQFAKVFRKEIQAQRRAKYAELTKG